MAGLNCCMAETKAALQKLKNNNLLKSKLLRKQNKNMKKGSSNTQTIQTGPLEGITSL